MIAVSVILTIGVVTAAVFIVRAGRSMVSGSSETIASYSGQMANSRYSFYDGTEISGSDLMDGYRELDGMLLPDGVTRFRFELYTLALDGGYSESAGLNITDDNYLNPEARFRCSLIYSKEHKDSSGKWVADSAAVAGVRAYQIKE